MNRIGFIFALICTCINLRAQSFVPFYSQSSSAVVDPNFLNYWKLTEGSGTTAFDSQGTNNGTVLNTNLFSGGYFSGNGTTSYIAISNTASSSLLNNPALLTICARVRLKTITGMSGGIALKFDGDGYDAGAGYGLYSGGNVACLMQSSGGSTFFQKRYDNAATFDGNFHSIICVIHNTGTPAIDFYVDGGLQTITPDSGGLTAGNLSCPTANFTIGGTLQTTMNTSFNSDIQYVRIYNRALSQSEITAISASGQ